ncbi:MAG TPA: hypothetical protein PLB62_16555, partial [Candidatus Sumerlaeota bacterium]|nr:hypothetical protein [Candidatus Sumerlaeota bacterium]
CDINVRYIGVFMAQTAGADIHDNRIRVDQYSVSTYIYGIYFQTSRSATDWSMNIYNNTIDQLQTVNYGATGIFLNTEVYATTPATPIYFNVFNNMICGFNFTVGSPTTNIYYRGIYCDARSNTTANRDVYVNMYYNSVYMPHFPNLTYNTSGRNYVYAIGCNAATNYGRTVDIRNNNIRVEQYYSAGLNISMSTANYVVNCDYNNISADTANGALTGRYNTTFEYATLADWQTAESGRFDRNSVDVNPLAPQSPLTGVWTAADNLLYTAYPSTRLHSLPVTGITTDIKGVARSATQPFMGCEEWQPVGPKAHFVTYNLNFGNCLLLSEGGVVASKALVIKNIGTEDLVTSGVVFMSGSPLFVFDSIDSPIAPGATGNCFISYTPSTLGASSATFRIATNDAYESNKILET